jgi:predicted transcriptional regulator
MAHLSDEDWRRLGRRCRTMGMTYGEIAREVGTSTYTVCRNLQRLGLAAGRRGRPPKAPPAAGVKGEYRPSAGELRMYLARMLDDGVEPKVAQRLLQVAAQPECRGR